MVIFPTRVKITSLTISAFKGVLNFFSSLVKNNQRPRQLQLQQPAVSHQQQQARSYQKREALSPANHHYQNHAAILNNNSHPINQPMALSSAMPAPPIKTPDEPHSPNELGLNNLSLNILNNNNNDSSNSSWLDSDQFIKPDMFLPPPTRGHQLFDLDSKERIIKFNCKIKFNF